MSLTIKTLLVRVGTSVGLVGTHLTFVKGLNVIHAPNTMGKSICVNSIIYGLGLEGMLSASYDAPFPSAITDTISVGDKQMAVSSSEIVLEVANGSGENVTIRRPVVGAQNKNLISVWNGFTISENTPDAEQRDYFVREPGAARREAGFHNWLATFIGWKLPTVPTFRDDEVPLYLECLFPLCIIEQKRGWAGFLSRIPTHYRIRDVSERSIEFLLALDTYQNSMARQRLREEQSRLRSQWQEKVAAVARLTRQINGVANGIPSEPEPLWPPQPLPQLVVPDGERWIAASQAMARARANLAEMAVRPPIEGIARVAQLQDELRVAEQELRREEYKLDEYLSELDQQREALGNVERRLSAIEQDLRRNKDARKLKQFGSMLPLHVTIGECPTCQQPLQDTLLRQSADTVTMTLDDNIAFIESQRTTFQAMRQNTQRLIAAKEARVEAQQATTDDARLNIRNLRQTLTGERTPAEREIRQRLQLEEWIQKAESALLAFDEAVEAFGDLSVKWRDLLAAIRSLPEGDLSPLDESKLAALQRSLRQQLLEYRFASLPPESLSISHDTFRPEHEKFDFEVNNSASDLIRMIWAYVNGLLELARSATTHHPGILIMDEPKQQGAHRRDLGTFLRRLSACADFGQQVIITTSEESDTFDPLVETLNCKVFDFESKILQPLS